MAFCKKYLDIVSKISIMRPLPFSLPACLNAHIKDNVFLKPVFCLVIGFNFKMTIGFYAIVDVHQFEDNRHDPALWFMVPLYSKEK